MKGKTDKSPAQQPVTTNGKEERGCLLDGGNGIFHFKKEGIPGEWKIKKEASITQYRPDPFEHNMEEKYKIPGGCNSQREVNKPNVILAMLRG